MGANWIGRWEGGRVREVRGRRVWVIERQRRVITLEVASEPEALAELALFLRDPLGYRSKREVVADAAVRLDAETLSGFLKHQTAKGASEVYRVILKKYLAEWGAALAGRDLRRVPLRELAARLDEWEGARKHRIIALKSFCSWLRSTGQLAAVDDASLSLRVPPARAAKAIRARGYPMAAVEAAYSKLSAQPTRDVVCLRAKTGMHHTEIERMAAGDCVLRELFDPSGIAGTVTFKHKSSRVHVVSLDAQALAAAQRLVELGGAPRKETICRALKTAAKRLGAPALNPSELRHSFATWASASGTLVRATGAGVALEAIAAVMGHTTPRTTKLFYEGNQVPPMIALPLRLWHPDDPTAKKGDNEEARSVASGRSDRLDGWREDVEPSGRREPEPVPEEGRRLRASA